MVPFIDNDEIFHKANDFLCQYHPSFSCPVPIDLIAEKELGLVIFPIPNLERYCEVHGGISKDYKSILIDEYQYTKQECRARFTIAHEIGHLVLHSKLFEEVSRISTDKEYLDFQNHVSIDDHRKLEIQANFFAEEILFPKDVFRDSVEGAINKLGGLNQLLPSDLNKIITAIGEKFGVTTIAALNKFKRNYPEVLDKVMINSPF